MPPRKKVKGKKPEETMRQRQRRLLREQRAKAASNRVKQRALPPAGEVHGAALGAVPVPGALLEVASSSSPSSASSSASSSSSTAAAFRVLVVRFSDRQRAARLW